MGYTKTMICLANSSKPGGRCVAGLELSKVGIGGWIRPVRTKSGGAIPFAHGTYDDGGSLKLLDIVEVPLEEHCPLGCQTENHRYDATVRWRRIGSVSTTELLQHADETGPLWIDGDSSKLGRNDRIQVDEAEKLNSSLALVRPKDLTIRVLQFPERRRARGSFSLRSGTYDLVVTDPKVKSKFLPMGAGYYSYGKNVLLCISLGEPHEGYRYKLIAAVIDVGE